MNFDPVYSRRFGISKPSAAAGSYAADVDKILRSVTANFDKYSIDERSISCSNGELQFTVANRVRDPAFLVNVRLDTMAVASVVLLDRSRPNSPYSSKNVDSTFERLMKYLYAKGKGEITKKPFRLPPLPKDYRKK